METKRPPIITLICVLAMLGAVFTLIGLSVPGIRQPLAQQFGIWFVPLVIVQLSGGIASIVGLWMMRKWGLYLYVALTALGIVIDVVAGEGDRAGGYFIPIFVIIMGFRYSKRMT
jgi:hypothetical protein